LKKVLGLFAICLAMSHTTEILYRRKKSIVFQQVDGLVHILDEKKDAIVTLNKTATHLWKCLSHPMSSKQLVKHITSIYTIDSHTATEDVGVFLKDMMKLGFLSTS